MVLTSGLQLRHLQVEGRERSYLVHLPARGPDRGVAWPVMLAFHGSGTNAEIMRQFSGLDQKADEAGFMVVFPNGSGRTPDALAFNVGGNYGLAGRQNINDVLFTSAILNDVATVATVDRGRVYSTGMSNGAIFSYRLAVELSDSIAAIAPVGGPLGVWDAVPSFAVPVCHFHGAADEHVPYSGGLGVRSLSKIRFRSAEESVRYWAQVNGCLAEPEVEDLPALIDDGTTVTRTTYRAGPAGAEVVLYSIHGMGHTWPGREPMFATLGPTTHNLIANDVIWEFFARHRR